MIRCQQTIISAEGTYLVSRIRGQQAEVAARPVGAPDAALTANAGMAAVTEFCGRLGVIEALDAAAGPVKQRDRDFGAGKLLTGIAAAQLAGEGLPGSPGPQCADSAGQQVTYVDADRLLIQRHGVVHSVMVGELEPGNRVYEVWHIKSDIIWPVEAIELNHPAADIKQCAAEMDAFGATLEERAESEHCYDPEES
jgi:hypothetical protein